MILRTIKQTRQSVEKVRQHIEQKLPVSSTLQNKVNTTYFKDIIDHAGGGCRLLLFV